MMRVVWRLDRVMADRGITLNDLAEKVGITPVNLSRIRTNKSISARFSTLGALCEALDCDPGDLIERVPESE